MKVASIIAVLLLGAVSAQAQEAVTGVAGHFQVRLRGAAVLPDPSATITISGTAIGGVTKVSDSFIPEADLTYFITDTIGVEAIAAVTKHTVRNSVAATVSNVWLLQAGADVPMGEGPYFLNLDVKKIFLGTHIRAAGGTIQASARLNPWIVGAGLGLRF